MKTLTLEDLTKRARARGELPPPYVCRRLRLAAGASLMDVAAVIGVSHEAVRTWETGIRKPRGENLERYAEVLRAFRDVLPADVLIAPEMREPDLGRAQDSREDNNDNGNATSTR